MNPPLSLYVHFPWCVQKCPYCDFNSHRAGTAAPTDRYVDALLKDLDREARRAGDRVIETIFLGGGTPSLFTPEEIGRVIAGVRARFDVRADAEITMEANPGTVDCGAPAGYRAAGVNRLSVGAQSFDDAMLERLGRIHRAEDVVRAVEAARAAGFDNMNLDLMHALPGQDAAGAAADLRQALALEPAHISWYQLTLEPNTVFHARPPENLPDEDACAEIQSAGCRLLRAAGFEQYEVSAWASGGRRSRHNMNYWEFGDYLAAGAGAHGKITQGGVVRRYRKPAHPAQFMQSAANPSFEVSAETVAGPDLVFEFMLNALRLSNGFDETLFVERTGLPASALSGRAAGAIRRGLLERTGAGAWRPTPLGRRFLDDLQAEFLPPAR
ncbi:MAG TPA: radical SAM family heme chaperone HemW [Woeseiaceae bacterium]